MKAVLCAGCEIGLWCHPITIKPLRNDPTSLNFGEIFFSYLVNECDQKYPNKMIDCNNRAFEIFKVSN